MVLCSFGSEELYSLVNILICPYFTDDWIPVSTIFWDWWIAESKKYILDVILLGLSTAMDQLVSPAFVKPSPSSLLVCEPLIHWLFWNYLFAPFPHSLLGRLISFGIQSWAFTLFTAQWWAHLLSFDRWFPNLQPQAQLLPWTFFQTSHPTSLRLLNTWSKRLSFSSLNMPPLLPSVLATGFLAHADSTSEPSET